MAPQGCLPCAKLPMTVVGQVGCGTNRALRTIIVCVLPLEVTPYAKIVPFTPSIAAATMLRAVFVYTCGGRHVNMEALASLAQRDMHVINLQALCTQEAKAPTWPSCIAYGNWGPETRTCSLEAVSSYTQSKLYILLGGPVTPCSPTRSPASAPHATRSPVCSSRWLRTCDNQSATDYHIASAVLLHCLQAVRLAGRVRLQLHATSSSVHCRMHIPELDVHPARAALTTKQAAHPLTTSLASCCYAPAPVQTETPNPRRVGPSPQPHLSGRKRTATAMRCFLPASAGPLRARPGLMPRSPGPAPALRAVSMATPPSALRLVAALDRRAERKHQHSSGRRRRAGLPLRHRRGIPRPAAGSRPGPGPPRPAGGGLSVTRLTWQGRVAMMRASAGQREGRAGAGDAPCLRCAAGAASGRAGRGGAAPGAGAAGEMERRAGGGAGGGGGGGRRAERRQGRQRSSPLRVGSQYLTLGEGRQRRSPCGVLAVLNAVVRGGPLRMGSHYLTLC